MGSDRVCIVEQEHTYVQKATLSDSQTRFALKSFIFNFFLFLGKMCVCDECGRRKNHMRKKCGHCEFQGRFVRCGCCCTPFCITNMAAVPDWDSAMHGHTGVQLPEVL